MNDQIIVLGGNSLKNEAWATRLSRALARQANVHLHRYRHWKNSAGEIDFQVELAQLTDYLNTHSGSYYIVAKSAGALLALQGVANSTLKPVAIVCIGLPVTYAEHRNLSLEQLVADNKVRTLYIQATGDPIGAARNVKALVAGHGSFVAIAGENHDYGDVDQLVGLTKKFFA